MPLFYQHNINEVTRLAIWKIEEPETFFSSVVPLQNSITHPHKRLQHLAGRYLLKFLFPDFPNEEILIADTRKPYLPYEQYHFSISHCANYAAAIVSKTQRVGLDIEIPKEKIQLISHKFLNGHEKSLLQSFAKHKELSLLTTIWSVKEAVFKWWGFGGVDFKENIQIQNILAGNSISINFYAANEIIPLHATSVVFDTLHLVWVLNAE